MIFDLAPSILAAEMAAKSIYHRMLATTSSFAEWRHDNPAISHLIDEATDLASTTLAAHGVPVAAFEQMASVMPKMIAASLNGMAAADASVASGLGRLPQTAPLLAPFPPPAPAPAARIVVAQADQAPIPADAPVPQPVPEPATQENVL